jgi:geranylgeranyl pyrophosphate synthase
MSSDTLDQVQVETQTVPLQLPVQVPRQTYRRAQSNIPDDKQVRVRLKRLAEDYIKRVGAIPPLTMDELREHTAAVLLEAGLDPIYKDYAAILVGNAAWRDAVARIPYDRRLLLIPKCLRVEDKCPAPFDEFGLLCKECGLCSIQDLTVEAERLGYAVLVAEGSAIVRSMIETGKIDAVVGVSCINVLEKCFPHMEAAAVPGVAIPLLQDDCINTTVDLDWVWDLIHLTSDDKTYRLDLDTLKTEVRGWFATDALDRIMGAVRDDDETEQIARDYLATGGKRWRPYLAACTYLALESDRQEDEPVLTAAVKKAAVAIECFHKASLIHDDIEDGDTQRYQRPTLHTVVGVPVALNIGDFLVGEGYRLLAELGMPAMTTIAAEGHVTLSRGQGRELLWVRHPEPLPSIQVLQIFRQKTSAAFEVALRLGAILGGADEETHDVLCKYSEALGIAYQIKDDLEDFNGDADSNDLEQVRLSLILAIAHKRASGAEKERIATLIRSGAPEDAGEVRRIVRELGVIDKTDDLLEAYKEEATRSLRFLSSPTLKGLMRRIVGKIFGEKLIEGYCSEFEARNAASRATGAESASGRL